jgi:hypothetical protein
MSNDARERTPAEMLKRRILNDTGDQVRTAAKAMFDLFTGGGEAVAESVFADIEAKERGESGAPMLERYRCTDCRGVHLVGQACDRIIPASRDTEPAPAPPTPRNDVPAARRVAPPVLTSGFEVVHTCEACALEVLDAEQFHEAERLASTFAKENLRACERCKAEQAAHATAYLVPRR